MTDPTNQEVAVLQSKCRIPPIPPDVLPRERLYGLLDGWQSRRLTFVHGAAGFGKTMLAAGWLHHRRTQFQESAEAVAWVSLEKEDNDPRLFLAHLAIALQPAMPVAAAAVDQNLRLGQLELRRITNLLLNSIDQHPGRLLIILDDYHYIEDDGIHSVVRRALEQGPPNLHILLLSRLGPPLALGSLGTIAGVLMLDTADLRLGADEIGRYVDHLLGISELSTADLAYLAQRSGGWAAGLKLAAIQLPHTADVHAFAAQLHGRNEWLKRFFVTEFLAGQPEGFQRFLLQTAVLEQLEASLCTAVTGEAESDIYLRQALATGFLVSPTNHAGTRLVYHDLFQELLRAELRRRCSEQEINGLRQHAAVWLEANGEIGAALRQYCAAGQTKEAVALVERHCLQAIMRDDYDQAQQWLAHLGAQQVNLSATLLLDQGWIYLLADRVDSLQYLQATEAAWKNLFLDVPDPREPRLERLVQLRAAHHLAGDHQEAQRLGTKLASQVSPHSHFIVRAFTHFLNLVDPLATVEQARPQGHEALAIFETKGWSHLVLSVSRALGVIAQKDGDVDEALRMANRARRLARISRLDQTLEAIYIHRLLADCFYELNRIEEARTALCELVTVADLLGEEQWLTWGKIMLALCDLVMGGDPSAAVELASVPSEIAALDVSPLVLDILSDVQVRYWILAGNVKKAWSAARHYSTQFDSQPSDQRPRALIAYLSGQLAYGEDLTPIEHLLTGLQQMAAANGRTEIWLRMHILQAWYRLKRGDEQAALSDLALALDIVARTGCVRYLLDIPALRSLLDGMDHPALRLYPELAARDYSQVSEIDLTYQELAVLRLLGERYSNAEIAQALVVTEGTVKWHLHNIYGKLEVKNRRAAVARARQLGCIA